MSSLLVYNKHMFCNMKKFLCRLDFQMVTEILVHVGCSIACDCKLQNSLHAHTHRISQLCRKSFTFKGQYLQ